MSVNVEARLDAMDWNQAVEASGETLAHAVRKAAAKLGLGAGRTLSSERVGALQWKWNWSGTTIHVIRRQRQGDRGRPMVSLTMSPEAIERLEEIAYRTGRSKSATVEALVREAPMPRKKTDGATPEDSESQDAATPPKEPRS